MNENILRGFCQKCDEMKVFPWPERFCPQGGQCEWNGFLSPNQIKIVAGSTEFLEWLNREQFVGNSPSDYEAVAEYLENYPFLVAKILSEAKT